jgi:hypothetical protein
MEPSPLAVLTLQFIFPVFDYVHYAKIIIKVEVNNKTINIFM